MKNRDKYICQVCDYDLLTALNGEIMLGKKCIIEAITGEYQYIYHDRCIESNDRNCDKCIQAWLNKEV